MTEQARSDTTIARTLHGRSQMSPRLNDKTIAFPSQFGDNDQPPTESRGRPAPLRDWSSAIDLVNEASEAIRIGEQRAEELEAHISQVITQAAEEMRQLNAQIQVVDQKLARSEERARVAEARANEAEAWLVRLHDAVFTAFAATRRNTPDDPTNTGDTLHQSAE